VSTKLCQFHVLECLTGCEATVDLHADLVLRDLIDVERVWGPARLDVLTQLDAAGVPRARWPESWHWNWQQKASQLPLLSTRVFAVHSRQGAEAVMMVKTAPYQSRLPSDVGKPIVYIDFLEVSPWNWTLPAINRVPKLKGLGSQLIEVAVAMSIEEEFSGRVGLHSLPQSEAWYGKRKFIRLGPDLQKQGLVYMERPAVSARSIPSTAGETS
jgi:hypothetical protein